MRDAILVRTSGPNPEGPTYTGIWSDPETTAEVLRIGYDYDSGGAVVEICFWRKPHRYVKALNEILRRSFGIDRMLRYRMRGNGREWYTVFPMSYYRDTLLDMPHATPNGAEWIRVRP